MIPGDLFGHVRRTDLVVVDDVAITPRHRTETGIEMRRHLLGPGHADIAGQVHVRAHYPGMHAARYRCVEMHHLATCMDQRIGASRAAQNDRSTARHFTQGRFEGFLDGGDARTLTLKAAITRPLVFNAQGNSGNANGSHLGCRCRYCFDHNQASLASISRASCC